MEEARRKSSSATVKPPPAIRKATGLHIDCKPVQVMESLGTNEPESIKMTLKRMFSRKKTGKVVRHSYSDPRLSPGSTAVDDDSERHIGGEGYFGVMAKKKRSPRGWIAAVMMIVVGALIAITFVLVGLGKALDNHELKSTTTQVVTVTSTTSIVTAT